MKLNLLPSRVSQQSQGPLFLLLGIVLIVLSMLGAAFMMFTSSGMLQAEKDRVDQLSPNYASSRAQSAAADTIIATATDLDRNIKLAQAMNKHNSTYTELYDEVLSYVPSFFRVTDIRATPNGATGATVTLTGILSSFQQYADANMAFLRIPDVVSVVRSGYTVNDSYVPGLTETDQVGSRLKPGQDRLSSDLVDRVEDLIARAADEPTGFQNVGGFGTTETDRGAGPNSAEVTFTIVLNNRAIQTPDPRATIRAGASAAPAGVVGAPGGPTFGGAAPGAGGAAPVPPPAGARAGEDDDEGK